MVTMKKLTGTASKSYAGFIPDDLNEYIQVFQTFDYDDALQLACEFYVKNPRVYVQEVVTYTTYYRLKIR